ncbi:MAG TPA: C25 family cysteine peptidase, partial [Flavitalea sp.]|nr:C25 family cysteine peptidase [Flavitalea sp.]
ATYRSSGPGGGFNAQVIDIDELVDQFAFGIKKHPYCIKNFLRYARDKFTIKPKFAFLIGRAVTYNEQRQHESDPLLDQLNLVPTFGYPASDNSLSSNDVSSPLAITPIGRLAVVRGSEVEDYLQKIREYENVQQTAPNTIEGREWMKNVIHVTGASDPYLGTVLCNYMNIYRQILSDTTYGARVASFCKASTSTGEQINNEKIANALNKGAGILTYFGHSSSSSLEFNLENPESYNNQGKYPVFLVNGCNAGNFYGFNPTRLLVNESLSEKFVLAKERGSIAFVASTHFGVVNYLNIYLNSLYGLITKSTTIKPLGELVRDALGKLITINSAGDFGARAHAEQINVHGDPAIFLNEQAKPDYVIEDPQVIFNPSFISVAEETFRVKVRIYNLGRSLPDSIVVELKRQFPDGTIETAIRKKIPGIRYADSLTIDLPISASRDKGSNKIIVTIDSDGQVDEISESNNTITKEAFIFEDEARTVFPFNYAIINKPNQKLFASTANPFSLPRDYLMEMDTTQLFNSGSKITKTLSSPGGVLEFDPGISYNDKTVYYWRVSPVTAGTNKFTWNTSSFVYINGPEVGFNQSHYFQHDHSDKVRISLGTDRKWRYPDITNNLFIRLGSWITSATSEQQMSISVNSGITEIHNTCTFSAIVFHVFDPITFKPWVNTIDTSGTRGLYNSEKNNCYAGRQNNFEFKYTDSISRKNAMDFMNNVVPDGAYVVARAFVLDPSVDPAQPQAFIADWKKDTLLHGSNKSLYHSLYAQGFTELDSFYRIRPWIFVYKKNQQADFFPKSAMGKGNFDNLSMSVDCRTPDTLGFITSPVFGPATSWKKVLWNGSSQEASSADDPVVSVIGIDINNVETTLFTLDKTQQNFDVSSVDASVYPRMKLSMRNLDSVTLTPYQLKEWKIYYTPVPEGALAGNLFLVGRDTVELGEPYEFGIAFKNISHYPMDSLAVKMTILDNNNVTHTINLPKKKPLIVGDTVMIRYQVDSRDYPETNTLFLEFNPNNDQPEQYHFNNFLFKNFFVRTDRINPMLDVTFDGIHILNRDLVSAKPHIQIKLKDDAKFLLLNDTTLQTVQVKYPDGTIRTHHFDNDTLRFTPATSSVDNSATVDFYPYFRKQYNPEGDEYELIVKGKDRSGNRAGAADFRIGFTVINKPMISNLLNYPNPFSTSTAFVFTLTGSEVPQNMKIQILTVTGKIVREITSQELGPIHIGRNITDYKWDGNDQFGQKLGNGVYLYRFVTTLNGKRMEKYQAKGDDTDMYFNNGYGKMYLMR